MKIAKIEQELAILKGKIVQLEHQIAELKRKDKSYISLQDDIAV